MHIHVYRPAVVKFIAQSFWIQKQNLLKRMKRAEDFVVEERIRKTAVFHLS